jgi:hypothetical protein
MGYVYNAATRHAPLTANAVNGYKMAIWFCQSSGASYAGTPSMAFPSSGASYAGTPSMAILSSGLGGWQGEGVEGDEKK